jgi:micrococcal nuclease
MRRALSRWIVLAALAATAPATGEPYTGAIRVIDGDTFELVPSREVIRVVDYDSPETGHRARCLRERVLGESVARRVRATLARARRIEIERTGRLDRYGRTLALVLVDGRSIGEDLIRDGGAVPWRAGAAGRRAREHAWCPRGAGSLPGER